MGANETRTLWISLLSALAAVFLLYSYTQEKSDELTKKFGAKRKVVVAAKDIPEMQTIDETMLDTVERPTSFVEPNAYSEIEDVVGTVALAPVKKDEQLLRTKVISPGPVTGLALQIQPDKRAITIPVDDMRGVARLIKPGDRIDIVAALDVGKGAAQKRLVKTLMQDVAVLATGLRIVNELPRLFERQGGKDYILPIRDKTDFTNITIEVDPRDVQDLVYILSTSPGSLFVTLRHPTDRRPAALSDASIESVLGVVTPAPRPLPAPVAAPVALPPPPSQPKGPFRKVN